MAFPSEKIDPGFQPFLIDLYQGEGNPRKALETAWEAFCDSPSLKSYQQLKVCAHQPEYQDDPWSALKDKAIQVLRGALNKAASASKADIFLFSYGYNPKTELIHIFLWDGDIETAWLEAKQSHCPPALLLDIAEKRAETHPEDVIPVYQSHVSYMLQLKTKAGYKEAVVYLKRIKSAMKALKQDAEFVEYMRDLRIEHKAKRTFISLLDATRGL